MTRRSESSRSGHLEGVTARWPAIARDGLILTGGVSMVLGIAAILAASISADADIAQLFVAGGCALVAVGVLVALRIGERVALAILTGLTGGSFALVLADMTSPCIDAPGRYAALRWVARLAANLIGLLAFQDGFRNGVGVGDPPAPQKPQPRARGAGRGRRPDKG